MAEDEPAVPDIRQQAASRPTGYRMTAAAFDKRSWYPRSVVVSLAFVYMLNFLDRQLLSVLAQPVKLDLSLSDTQLGLLTGVAFAVFYTLFGIPVAALADRWNRVRVVALACGLWSIFTAASGFVTGFLTLALARVGVSVGEAGCSPPSYSIISDYFPPARRGRALAGYLLGVPAGSLLGVAAGASIAAHYGWRAAFIAVGTIGLVLSPLIPLVVREPKRGRYDDPEASVGEAIPGSVWGGLSFFVRSPTLVLNAIAAGLMAFVCYGILNWAPTYLLRVQGMTLAQLAATYSVVSGVSIATGLWLGGVIVDRLGARMPTLCALMPGVSILLMTPFLFGFTLAKDWKVSLAFLFVPLVLSHLYLTPTLTAFQNRTPARYRATASAVLLFLLNLIGLGGGPLFVGAMSDWLQPQYGAHALGHALQWLTPFCVLAFLGQSATAWSMRRDRRVAAYAGT